MGWIVRERRALVEMMSSLIVVYLEPAPRLWGRFSNKLFQSLWLNHPHSCFRRAFKISNELHSNKHYLSLPYLKFKLIELIFLPAFKRKCSSLSIERCPTLGSKLVVWDWSPSRFYCFPLSPYVLTLPWTMTRTSWLFVTSRS